MREDCSLQSDDRLALSQSLLNLRVEDELVLKAISAEAKGQTVSTWSSLHRGVQEEGMEQEQKAWLRRTQRFLDWVSENLLTVCWLASRSRLPLLRKEAEASIG